MSFRWEIIIIFFGSPIHWRSQHVPRGGTCHTWKTKLLGKKKSLTLNHIYIWETCVLMGPFGKYMVFRTQLYEIWKPAFYVESYIFFMHSEPTTYFVPRLSPGLVIFQNYPFCSFFSSYTRHPPLSPSLLSEIDQHFAGVITDRRSHLSPVGNLPPSLLPFPISLSFILFRHHQERERGKVKGREEEVSGLWELWATTDDEVDKVSIEDDNRRWRWWRTRVRGKMARLSSTVNLYLEVSSPSSTSLSPLLNVSPYVGASVATAVNDRESCSYDGGNNNNNNNARDQHVP